MSVREGVISVLDNDHATFSLNVRWKKCALVENECATKFHEYAPNNVCARMLIDLAPRIQNYMSHFRMKHFLNFVSIVTGKK